jgi:hypothetical protein
MVLMGIFIELGVFVVGVVCCDLFTAFSYWLLAIGFFSGVEA